MESTPCYWLDKGDYAEGVLFFEVNHELNQITQIKELDRETTEKYDLLIISTNDCEKMPPLEDVGENSKLNITINVDDINDTPPKFNDPVIFESISLDDYKDWKKEVKVNLFSNIA